MNAGADGVLSQQNDHQRLPKTENDQQPTTSKRFHCPYPGCKRSFAELWRLKVHYRAPPNVTGSGRERGHGKELDKCPKCQQMLKPGKHHVGCTGGKTPASQKPQQSKPEPSKARETAAALGQCDHDGTILQQTGVNGSRSHVQAQMAKYPVVPSNQGFWMYIPSDDVQQLGPGPYPGMVYPAGMVHPQVVQPGHQPVSYPPQPPVMYPYYHMPPNQQPIMQAGTNAVYHEHQYVSAMGQPMVPVPQTSHQAQQQQPVAGVHALPSQRPQAAATPLTLPQQSAPVLRIPQQQPPVGHMAAAIPYQTVHHTHTHPYQALQADQLVVPAQQSQYNSLHPLYVQTASFPSELDIPAPEPSCAAAAQAPMQPPSPPSPPAHQINPQQGFKPLFDFDIFSEKNSGSQIIGSLSLNTSEFDFGSAIPGQLHDINPAETSQGQHTHDFGQTSQQAINHQQHQNVLLQQNTVPQQDMQHQHQLAASSIWQAQGGGGVALPVLNGVKEEAGGSINSIGAQQTMDSIGGVD